MSSSTHAPSAPAKPDPRLDIPRSGNPVVTKAQLAAFILSGKDAEPIRLPYRTSADVAKELGIPMTGTINVHVNTVQAEDGSGESWNVEGYAWVGTRSDQKRVTIYTRTDIPTGVIMFR